MPSPKPPHRIFIFGASLAGLRALEYFKTLPDTEILGWIDNDPRKHHTVVSGLTVYPPSRAQQGGYDKIWIASTYHREIRLQLLNELGISKNLFQNIPMTVQKGFGDFSTDGKLELAVSLLKKVNEIMKAHGLPYLIDHGTLLGIFRDGHLLPWDNDIDLAIRAEDAHRILEILKEEVPKFEFPMSATNQWCVKTFEGVIEFPNEKRKVLRILKIINTAEAESNKVVVMDLILKYLHDNRRYWMVDTMTLSAPNALMNKIDEHAFSGVTFPVPSETDEYLKVLYNDWKTPVKEWDHTRYSNLEKE